MVESSEVAASKQKFREKIIATEDEIQEFASSARDQASGDVPETFKCLICF